MLRTLSLRLAAVAMTVASVLAPSALNAQKAMVYCPVGIDAGGCTTIVAALNADATRFPDGADAGYDGTQGTLDLATADLSGYAVFVVPSLADGPDAQPYALLRNGTIAARLQAAFVGRVAVWSGTPDVGTTNRSSKDALIRNLAAWARPDASGTHGPGVVALQDNSDDGAARYGWLGSISALSVTADTTFDVYANVQVLTSTGQTIVTNGGLQLGYTNMASFGLIAGPGGRNDATGDRSTRVVLVTAAGEAADPSVATVSTDKDDYTPGDTVTVTGAGWDPGETVSLLFHEDANPPIHPDKTLNAVADALGHIFNHEYEIDSTDIGIRFTLTATGQTSGRTAQATFTDNKTLTVAFAGGGLGTVTGGEGSPAAGINCPGDCTESVDNNANISLTASPAANSTLGAWSVVGGASAINCPTGSATCTFNMNNKAIDVTVTFSSPDLTITKTHPGTIVVGTGFDYTITVKNSGSVSTAGLVTVSDVLPAGLTFNSTTATGWSCSGTTTIQCTRSNALAAGASYPAITLNVTPTAPGTVTNTATVSGGGESNATNNSASDPTTVVGPVDLTLDKSHTGDFTLGVNGTYSLVVSNSGGTPTSANVTVTDVLPGGLGFVSGTGTGWNTCTAAAQTVTCVRPAANAIAAGGSAPAITLTVSVGTAAAPSATNTASVAGGGEPAANNGNNSDSDPTTVIAPDLTVNKSHTGNFDQGVNGTYDFTVSNIGGLNTSGTVTVTDVLPAGLTFISGGGGGWTCNVASGTVTCTRGNTINAGASTPSGSITVSVGAAALPSVTNTATVSGGNEPAGNNGNNSDSDPTTVGAGVDLTIDKSHTGNFTQGVNGTYTLTVANPGTVVTSANVTVTDNLPAGLGFVSGTGTGWNACTAAAQVVTCVRPVANTIAAGGTAPPITLTVTVAAAAVPSVTNTASVAGGGEPAGNTGNNSDSDPTTVTAGVDLTIDKSHTGNFTEGVNGTYSIVVSNTGGSATSANVTVTDVLPAGLGFVSGTGTGWNACTAAAQTVTCVRPSANAIPAAGSAPAITLTVSVAASAVPSVTNTASVAGGGEPAANNGNNSDSDPTTVVASNQPPVVEAGGPYTGNEGSAIALNGASATDPDAGDTPIIKWTYVANGTVDAGTSCSFSNDAIAQPTFTCNDDGAFTLTLKVDDQHGHVVQDNADVTVNNLKPTATAGGPYTGNEGSAIQLGGTGDDPAANDDDPKLTYKWTVNTTGIDAGGACTFDDDTKKNAKITCTDDGAFKVSLVATDDDGASSDASIADLTVANVKPVAHAGGPYSGNEGSDISLTGSATDVGSNDGFTYKWTADVTGIDAGGACTFGNDTHASTTVNCTDNGAFKVKLTVTDDDGDSHFEEVALSVANVDPVADAGGDYSGNEGSPVSLTGSASDVGSNDTFTWSWEALNGPAVDAGATCSFSDIHAQNPTVTCTDDGEFKLTLTVKDDNNGQDSDDAVLTLQNVKPVANAGGPYSGNEGAAIALNGSANDPGDNDDPHLTYKWTVNTTGIDAGGQCTFDDDTKKNAEVTCTDDSKAGTFTLSLVATDDDGASSVASNASLTVLNVDPVADAGGDYHGDEGSPVQLNGSASDVGSNDTFTWSWEAVNGPAVDAGATCSFSDIHAQNPTVACTDDGEFKLTLTVKDDNNGQDTDDATLTLQNVKPVATAGGPYSGDEGSPITLNGSANDPGDNDDPFLTYKWTVTTTGIDAGGACTFDDDTKKNAQVTCTDDSNGGNFTLSLVATDDDGASSLAGTATLTVANLKPVATAGSAYSGNEGSAIQLNGSADDPGNNDDPHLSYKWTLTASGIDAGGACSFDNDTKKDAKVTCTDDSNGGTFTLSLVATDDDGASSVASTTTLAVLNLKPVAAAGGAYSGNEGSAIALSGSANDPGDNDDPHLTYLWTATPTGIDGGGTCSFDDATKTNAQVTCTDDSNGATFTLTLVATDDDGASSTGSTATLTVTNVKPLVATITKSDGTPLPTTIVVAGTLNIKVPFGDAGSNDTQKAQIDCGEGAGYVSVNSGNNVTTGFLTACTFASVGAKTVKVKVADDDGAYDEKSFGLTVKYTFIGFSAPVDRPNMMNVSKAGQAIPLKWQLLDANGQPVTNLTNVDIKINALSCGGNVPTDLIEEYASGASGLRNMGGGNYQFNWKTPTNYTGTCKNIGLDFGSGYVEVALANFNFKS